MQGRKFSRGLAEMAVRGGVAAIFASECKAPATGFFVTLISYRKIYGIAI